MRAFEGRDATSRCLNSVTSRVVLAQVSSRVERVRLALRRAISAVRSAADRGMRIVQYTAQTSLLPLNLCHELEVVQLVLYSAKQVRSVFGEEGEQLERLTLYFWT
jgi:predicted amino acid dehydrogenase